LKTATAPRIWSLLFLLTALLLCSLTGCIMDPLPQTNAQGGQHCASWGCALPPVAGSVYCSLHKCAQWGCAYAKAFGSQYCFLHKSKGF